MQKQVQYQYAKMLNKQIVDITIANKNVEYYCLGCSKKVIPIQGLKNKHHYRHYEADCNKETYYHIAGKLAFESVWKARINSHEPFPLTLQRSVQCDNPICISLLGQDHLCKSVQEAKFDLTQLFIDYAIEQRDSTTGLIPDILLSNTQGHKCYIEICNTHACTLDKINSGVPIIEIRSSCDEDIKYILNGSFSYNDLNIILYNFKPRVKKSSTISQCNNTSKIITVSIGDDFRLNYSHKNINNEITDGLNNISFRDDISPIEQLTKIRQFLSLRPIDPIGYRNCFCCEYAIGWEKGSVFCTISSMQTPDYNGVMCCDFNKVIIE